MESYIHIIKGRRGLLMFITILAGMLVGAATLLRPLSYSATFRLLITQRAAFTLDPYTAIRSSELVGENLAQIVHTSAFFDRILKSGYNIDQKFFSTNETIRRKQWTNMVDAKILSGTGILQITAYQPNRDQAVQIASAIALILSRDGADYIGRDIQIRLVDAPLASRLPVKPSVPGNAFAGLVLGFCLGNLYIYLDHRHRKHHGNLVS